MNQYIYIMKKTIKSIIAVLALTFIAGIANAQDQESGKKVQTFTVSRTMPVPVDKVWAHIADDFGGIAKAHPGLAASSLLEGSEDCGEGCERVCYLNEKETKYTKEVMTNYDKDSYSFDANIFALEGIPMDESVSVGHYALHQIDDNTTTLVFTMDYRTKPAFMGALAKGKLESTIGDYLLAVEHYLTTGEQVNKDNFKEIKKQYKD